LGKPNIRFARYADDWCVFITRAGKQNAAALRDQIRDFLRDAAGLELSAEKTHITHVRDGFDFLGFRLIKENGRRGDEELKIKIGDKARRSIRLRLSESLRYRPQQESVSLRIQRTSRLIRGWREYFRTASQFSKIASRLDHFTFWEAVKAICRKFDLTTRQCFKRYYRRARIVVGKGNSLARFSDYSRKWKHGIPQEYVPGGGVYLDDYDDDSALTFLESKQRMGGGDMRWEVMVGDSLRCRRCGAVVDYSTAHIDHIIPVKRFASFRLAHRMENLQTLCHTCHKEKTRDERHSQR
jgi:RNA-directed DNA polymerase